MQRRVLHRLALLLAAALVLLIAAGCGPTKQAAFQLDYQIKGGIAGFDTRFVTSQTGHFTWSERGKQVGEGDLAPAEVTGLQDSLAKVPWDSLQASYDAAPQVRDDLTYVITATQGGKQRTVTVAGTAQAPQEVRDLIVFLEAVRHAHQPAPVGLPAPAKNGGGPAPEGGTSTPTQPSAAGQLQDSRDGFLAYVIAPSKTLYWQGPGGSPLRLIRLQDLPETFTPQGAGKDVSFGVGKDHFTAIALAPGGDRVAFGSMGVHGFLAVVDAPAGSNTGGHLFPLDLGFETAYKQLLWSPGGRYLAVLAAPPSGADATLVYDVSAGTRLDSGFQEMEQMFPTPDYSLTPVRWESGASLRVRVAAGVSGNHDPARLGDWLLVVSTGSITRIGQ